jgi:carbamoyltransferase
MIISIYGYHDASISLKQNGKYYIYEAERFFRRRYATLTQYFPVMGPTDDELHAFYSYIRESHEIEDVDVCYYHEIYPCDMDKLKNYFNIKRFERYDHHYAHACCAYYQSNFEDCYVITYDGSGKNQDDSESSFVGWYADRFGIRKIEDFQPYNLYSLGNFYLGLSDCLSSIRKNPNSHCQIGNAGKLMGLCSFGTPVELWKQPLMQFLENGSLFADIPILTEKLGFDPIADNLTGKKELDFAATLQWVFETKFFNLFEKLHIEKGSNICLAGGCALNILVNQKLHDMGYNVFVPPNSSDCGLSFGILADHFKDKKISTTYNGFDILDKEFVDDDFKTLVVSDDDIASLLYRDKKIIGYIEGLSECGPRALGNRSILCYPDITNLKLKLNAQVKFREWFRPFGAMTKLENIDRYFENGRESPYMNFCPTLRPQFRWDSITHIDNTCRIQTVSYEQHPRLHKILTAVEEIGGEGILLNTSFNIKAQPILTRLEDAFVALRESDLDGFVYNNVYYHK